VPWRGQVLLGTDYEPAENPPTDPGGFLAEADRAFPWASLAGAEVSLVHEGLVPGRGGAHGLATRPRLHDHESEDALPGLVSIQGVKYTTARSVAERAVDLVQQRLGRPVGPCRTASTALSGARPLDGDLEGRTREVVRREMALTLADAVLRRLDLGTGGRPESGDLSIVCTVMAGELGWDEARVRRERDALARAWPPPVAGGGERGHLLE
jgi:glycerol-3-phosphate dehydrogenase